MNGTSANINSPSENIGNSNLTINELTRKLVLGGALSTDGFSIRNSADTADIFKVQGDETIRIDGNIGHNINPSSAIMNRMNGSGETYGLYTSGTFGIAGIIEDSSSSRRIYINQLKGGQDGIHINSGSGQTALRNGLWISVDGSNTNQNRGIYLSVANGSVNYALFIANGDIRLGTVDGTKIGTATNEKLSFWNKTPIVQPTTAITAEAFVANTSGISDDTATYGGYTIGQIAAALKNIGILA